MTGIDQQMYELTVASGLLIADWSDIRVRGHLTEHPDLVEHRLKLLEAALRTVRHQVESERPWSVLPSDSPQEDFDDSVRDFVEHSCDCEWCLRYGPSQGEAAPNPTSQFKPGWLQEQVDRSVESLSRLPEELRRTIRGGGT